MKILLKKLLTDFYFQEFFQKIIHISSKDDYSLPKITKFLRSLLQNPEILLNLDISLTFQSYIDLFIASIYDSSFLYANTIKKTLCFLLEYLLIFQEEKSKIMDISSNHKNSIILNEKHLSKFSTLSFLIKFQENRNANIRLLSWNILLLLVDVKILINYKSLMSSALEIFIEMRENQAILNIIMNFLRKTIDLMLNEEESEENSLIKQDFMRIIGQKSNVFTHLYFIKEYNSK